jgi:hypothetical protein
MSDHPRNYETARTRHWRLTDLHPTDANTIAKIEEFGCFVLTVGNGKHREMNYTYTIGVYDTCGKPDLITAGLHHEVAHSCLNEAARLLRTGIDLTQGRHADLIGNVDCEFRPVDPKWVGRLMNWGNWYYGGTEYPVLQVVYPDLKNRFPEDEGFDCRFKQPLMQPDAPLRHIEEDFWNGADETSSLFGWKFAEGPHTTVYISKNVHAGLEPVTFVYRDPEGDWQFTGDTGIESGGVAVCFHHPIDSDPSLKELADLPVGWCAERDEPGAAWERSSYEPEEDDEESEDQQPGA